jgi:hypothetical protein
VNRTAALTALCALAAAVAGAVSGPAAASTTGTTVVCVSDTVSVGNATSCTATVADTGGGTTPTGTVDFSSDGSGSFDSTECTLDGAGTCSVTYTPDLGSEGDHTITADYAGDPDHDASSGDGVVAATERSSATALDCSPASVVVGAASTCTATVSDDDTGGGTTPTGTVDFSSDGSGSFDSTECTLDGAGTCSVTYTPDLGSEGTHTLTAGYSGDGDHSSSSGDASVDATVRSTATTVDCTPSSFAFGGSTTCTATVADSDTGSGATPEGEVDWSDSGGTFDSTSCTLSSGACSVAYTPAASGSHALSAAYGGDGDHAGSSGGASVTVFAAITSLLYGGPDLLASGGELTATATLTSSTTACSASAPVAFSLNDDPTTAAVESQPFSYALGAPVTDSRGVATLTVATTGWLPGVYTLSVDSAASGGCPAAHDQATFTYAPAGKSAGGGGWYSLPGSGRVNFAFEINKQKRSGVYKGQALIQNTRKWRLKGKLTRCVKTGSSGAASGSGSLYVWDQTLNGGLGDWKLAAADVPYTLSFVDPPKGKAKGKGKPAAKDMLGVRIAYATAAGQPALPNSVPVAVQGDVHAS